MTDGFQRQLRTYRLWRTATVLLIVGAVEFGVLAYQRQNWLVGLIMLPLVAFAMVAARRAARFRIWVGSRASGLAAEAAARLKAVAEAT